jgi:CheY-like chemotaxis protein
VRAISDGLGRGTTMTVRLPLVTVAAVALPEPRHESARTFDKRAGGSTPSLAELVLVVVDDEEDSRAFACAALRTAGATVIECGNVEQALAAARVHRPHVLVSDIAMPGQDGFALIHQLRALPADQGGATPCIALTAHAREDDVLRCLEAGFQRHLAKPLESAELVRCVASCRELVAE